MAINRWDPFRDIVALQNRMNTIFGEYTRGTEGGDALATSAFTPAVDIYEDANTIVLNLEVPGMRQEDFDIQVENRTLTVSGERKFENEKKTDNYHRVERRYGSFFRAFTLPQTVDTEIPRTCRPAMMPACCASSCRRSRRPSRARSR